MYYSVEIARYPIIFEFHDEQTHLYFTDRIFEYSCKTSESVMVPERLIHRYQKAAGCNYSYAEYMNALYIASNALLKYNCCSFHSVAICVNGKGYLITGVSGTGKTTQYLNLKALYPDYIRIINGDKPFLQFTDDGIFIHTSPWRGKEDFGSNIICKLYGIIFLKQSERNLIFQIRPEDAVFNSLRMFLYHPDCEKTVHKVCDLDRKLLTDIPMWYFLNKGDFDSSEMLYKIVLKGCVENE